MSPDMPSVRSPAILVTLSKLNAHSFGPAVPVSLTPVRPTLVLPYQPLMLASVELVTLSTPTSPLGSGSSSLPPPQPTSASARLAVAR
ncbi:hypothetical protein D3C86_1854050 [compost metagenome]